MYIFCVYLLLDNEKTNGILITILILRNFLIRTYDCVYKIYQFASFFFSFLLRAYLVTSCKRFKIRQRFNI